MSGSPFFSVIVPVYNRSGLLAKSLQTILIQTFRDFEVIIVDDGSTDNTAALVENLIISDTRIRYIRQENSERGAARNNGFKKSSGKYVVFFDSDDLMHPHHLEILHQNILKENFPNFIATKFDFVNERGKRYSSDMQKLTQKYYDYTLFLSGNPLACNICVNKSNKNIFLFEEDRKYSIKEDWLFMIRNMKTDRLFIIDQITISMLDHSDRSMRSDNPAIITKTLNAYEWIIKNISLDEIEMKQLLAHVNYFCGIHSFLDDNNGQSQKYSLKAMKYGGIKIKYLSLFLKSFAGRKFISRFK